MSELSLRDQMSECVDDIENIVKQIMDQLLNHRHQKSGESLVNMVKLFDTKQAELRQLLEKVNQFHERASLIRDLEKCVRERDELINDVSENLQGAELALTSAVYQANQKLKLVREAELRPVNTDELIKLAHQISKGSSVAAPFNWQQGDPSRPFPTEPEFRESTLMAGRQAQPPISQSFNLTRNYASNAIRTPPQQMSRPGSVQSPLMSQQRGFSPRTGLPGQVSSPRGQVSRMPSVSGANWRPGQIPSTQQTTPGGSAIPQRRPAGQSPQTSSPTVHIHNGSGNAGGSGSGGGGTSTNARGNAPPLVSQVEQMSTDSSSSSSSDDESPR